MLTTLETLIAGNGVLFASYRVLTTAEIDAKITPAQVIWLA